MYKQPKVLQSYIYIIEYLQWKNQHEIKPKIIDFQKKLQDKDIVVDKRTIERYIKTLREKFGIPIYKENHLRGGYWLATDEMSEDINNIIQNMKILAQAEYFQNIIKNSTEFVRYFSFSNTRFKGFHWLDQLIHAIHNQKTLKISHKKFNENKAHIRFVHPYMLKEYEGRWYLVGLDKKINEIRNFGIDRIEQVELTSEQFKKPELNLIKRKYKNVIGLTVYEPEIVRLRFDKFQKNYFKSQPWHSSAEIIKETDDYLDVELFVGINHELEQKILSAHYTVKVLYPPKLASAIKDLLQQALTNYK